MTHENMRLILRVLWMMSQMSGGGGLTNQSEIAKWSGVSRSTVYRYLPRMCKLKLIDVVRLQHGKKYVFHYRISIDGLEWLERNKLF